MYEQDTAHALAALSAHVTALEAATQALAQGSQPDRGKAPAVFDAFSREMLDRYSGMPVDERVLELMGDSLSDVRALLQRSKQAAAASGAIC
jgi:hypothetical protein